MRVLVQKGWPQLGNYGVDSRQSIVESVGVSFRYPPPLEPGALIAVVAPSSPFDADAFWRGLAWLRDRYSISLRPGAFTRAAYLAGDDSRRAAELSTAMRDPAVRAIVAARGGYGAMRVLDALPWADFAQRPKWIVGFSDITALHLEANARAIASVHAPHVTGLGPTATPQRRASWR